MVKLPSARRIVQSYLAERPSRAELRFMKAGDEWRGRKFPDATHVITGVLGGVKVQLFAHADRVIEDFANWPSNPDDILRFTRHYGVVQRDDVELWSVSSELIARRFLVDCSQWLKSQALFRTQWERTGKANDELARVLAEQINPKSPIERAVRASVVPSKAGGFEIELQPDDLSGALWLAFLAYSDRTRKCQNATCSAPYFIAARRDQKYCTEVCSRLVANRTWWAKKGAQWRAKKMKERNSE